MAKTILVVDDAASLRRMVESRHIHEPSDRLAALAHTKKRIYENLTFP
jgi:hypothetical protein